MPEGFFDLGGTIRSALPSETRARIEPAARYVGITRVARVTSLDRLGVPVSVAVRPSSRLLCTAQGKGTTPELADISAVMESIETWHAENLPPAPVLGSAGALASRHAVLEPGRLRRPCGLWRPLDPSEEIPWVRTKELQSGEEVLVPAAAFDLDTSHRGLRDGLSFRTTTTGLASGNSWNEAVLHGLYEVVERDAHFRLNRMTSDERAGRIVDQESVGEPALVPLLMQLRAAGVEVEILDMTSHIPLPAFRATIMDRSWPLRFSFDEGMGVHLDRRIALSRALTEAAQSRLAYISGSRDDLFPDVYRLEMPRSEELARRFRPGRPTRAYSGVVSPPYEPSLEANLRHVLRLVGVPVYALDHTRPDVGIPVVHVLCPDLHDVVGAEG